jgi:hypothetical protein
MTQKGWGTGELDDGGRSLNCYAAERAGATKTESKSRAGPNTPGRWPDCGELSQPPGFLCAQVPCRLRLPSV